MGVASGGTRRIVCAVQAAVLAALILAVPETAHAWFGWLDKFSGPGPFKGVVGDVRVWCGGPKTGFGTPELASAQAFLREFADAEGVDGDHLRLLLARARAAWSPTVRMMGDAPIHDYALVTPRRVADLFDDRLTIQQQQDSARASLENIERQAKTVLALGGIGSVWSLCDEVEARRISVGVNAELWWTHGDDRFADGKAILFGTIGPSATLRVFSDRDYDVLDIGISGGLYSFRSRGFDAFGGGFLQPQLTVHFPPVWQALPHDDPRRWLSAISFRHARTFLLDTLTASELNAAAVPRDAFRDPFGVGSNALFFNLQTLLPWKRVDPARLSR